jgi:hypothetical protein
VEPPGEIEAFDGDERGRASAIHEGAVLAMPVKSRRPASSMSRLSPHWISAPWSTVVSSRKVPEATKERVH